jgi:predicted ester cyclase
VGDEIIQIVEGDRVYKTVDSLVYGSWGLHPSEPFHVEALRDQESISFDYVPVVMTPQSSSLPYPLDVWRQAILGNRSENPEYHYELEYMLEEGNLVSIFLSVSGFNNKYKHPCAYSEAEVWEFEGDKVARIIETRNTLAELSSLGYHFIPPGKLENLEAQTGNEFDLNLYRQFIESLNTRDIELSDRISDELFSSDLVQHVSEPPIPPGIEAQKAFVHKWLADNPDAFITIDELRLCEDRLILRARANVNNPTTGAVESVVVIECDRLVDGKIAEVWNVSAPGNW